MRHIFSIIFLFSICSTYGQNRDSCALSDLPPTKEEVFIIGLNYQIEIFLNKEFLQAGIELKPRSASIKLIGYSVVTGCGGCDIVSVTVCGNRMEEQIFKGFYRYVGQKGTWLDFYNINIEQNGKRLIAPEFKVRFQ